MTITNGGLDDPRVQALLAYHARAETGRGSAHALDLSVGITRHSPLLRMGWRVRHRHRRFFGDYVLDPNSVFMTLELS